MVEANAARIAYKLAEERIAQAKAQGWKFLNLSAFGGERTYGGEERSGDARLHFLNTLPPEIVGQTGLLRLDLQGTQITDLTPLAGMASLRHLYLSDTKITDLTPLAGLTSIEFFILRETQITDLTPLAGLTSLRCLDLTSTQVTDLTQLASMTSLTLLWINRTQVRDLAPLAGLVALTDLKFSAIPACTEEPDLRALSEIRDDAERTQRTLEWLRTQQKKQRPKSEELSPDAQKLTEAKETSETALGVTPKHSESDYEVTDNGERLTEKPLPGDVPDIDDPYRLRQQSDRLSTLSDLAKELFNDIKADQPNVPDALRRDLKRYADEMQKTPSEVRPQYLRSRMKVFVIAQGDEDVRMGLGGYTLAKFEELIDEHHAVMAAFYGAQIERLRQREEDPLTADATPPMMEKALEDAIALTSGPDWDHYPALPETLSEDLIHWRNTLHDEQLKLLMQPEGAAKDGATRLAIDNRVYVATVGQAVGRAVEWAANDPKARATANLGSATAFLQMLGRILGF